MDRPTDEAEEDHGAGLAGAAAAAGVSSWVWDLAGERLYLDGNGSALFGIAQDAADGHLWAWQQALHPDDAGWVVAAIEKAITTGTAVEIEHRIRRADGQTRWVHVRGRIERDAQGRPTRLRGAGWDSTGAHLAQESLQHALRYMSDGFLAIDRNCRITNANVQAERLLGVTRGLTGQVLWELPDTGKVPELEAQYRKAAGGMRPASFECEWPDTGRWYRFRFIPVPDGMACYFADVTRSRQRRDKRHAAREAARNRAARIQELAAALAEATTSQDVLAAVAERILPPFGASGLIVEVPEGDRMRVLGYVGYTEAFIQRMDWFSMRELPAIGAAMRDHQPMFLSSPGEYAERFPEVKHWPSESGKRAWVFMPLVASGRAIAMLVIAFAEPRRLTRAERALLLAVSGLMAQAFERARLYDAEHARAQELQRALLPAVLPSLPAITAAARYLPAGIATSIGGDWYDVIPLSADRVALVIGDVMGHGLPEAVIMGRLRTAVQTLSDLDLPPDEILGHLNEVVNGLGAESLFVTCVYAVYDPVRQACAIARAGHPPPAIVAPDGTVRFLEGTGDPPLGVAEPPFEALDMTVPDDSLLVLYTDGLVESPELDIDTGMARLARFLHRHHGKDLDQLSGVLIRSLLPSDERNNDDAALLIVRTRATPPESVAEWPLPDDPTAAQIARKRVREQLSAWQLDELAINTEMLASEMIANVIRHARGPIRLRLIRSQALTCEVFDGSLTTPRPRRAAWTDEGGRGLHLIAALSDRWGTRYMAAGKCIWTEQSLPVPGARSLASPDRRAG
jgi:PAS domain S-box-containing protein